MAAPYGVRGRWRKAVIALALLLPVRGAARRPSGCWCSAIRSPPATACRTPTASRRSSPRPCGPRPRRDRSSMARCPATPSAGGLARLDWALGDGADAAIVELGANDGLRGVDPAETEKNLTAILDTLAARHIPVLLTGMYALPNLGPDYAAAFRAVFDRLGAAAGRALRPVLPRRRGHRAGAQPARRAASQRRGRAAHRRRGCCRWWRSCSRRCRRHEAVRRSRAALGAAPARGDAGGRRHSRRALGAAGELPRHAALHRRGAALPGRGDRPRAGRAEGAGVLADAGRHRHLRQRRAQPVAVARRGAQRAARSAAEQDRDGAAALRAGAGAAAVPAAS